MTAAFNKNVLAVLNTELGADFDLDAFEHVAVWDAKQEWIEMRLRSAVAQTVHLPAIDLVAEFADGEEMRTEVSAKFRREGVTAELAAAGLGAARMVDGPAGPVRPVPVRPGVSWPVTDRQGRFGCRCPSRLAQDDPAGRPRAGQASRTGRAGWACLCPSRLGPGRPRARRPRMVVVAPDDPGACRSMLAEIAMHTC